MTTDPQSAQSSWRDKRVIVTGAFGFKGSWACSILHELGASVYAVGRTRVVDRDSPYALLRLEEKVRTVPLDIADSSSVDEAILAIQPHVILHLAAMGVVRECHRNPRRAFAVNAMGTLNLLEACRRYGVCERVLIASTDHVFGRVKEDEVPLPEDSQVCHGGMYETSKAAMELIARSYDVSYRRENDTLPLICISRAANVFGPGDDTPTKMRVIPEFIHTAHQKNCVQPRYPEVRRQFIHVTDALSGYIIAVSTLARLHEASRTKDPEKSQTAVFHFAIEKDYPGTDEPYIRIGKLADLVADITHTHVDYSQKRGEYPPNENRVQGLRCDKTKSLLGWEPKRKLEEALIELADFYKPEVTREERADRISAAVKQTVQQLLKYATVQSWPEPAARPIEKAAVQTEALTQASREAPVSR